ncbi:MAG: hypothetical protein TE42_03210 [Candidatus Synechococcus spongiarum SP3]|uniref:Uncharacterized protein n=1 Tax=Candidatus Synechococcus spongiarum SP3 TaxID=1604020 RepID=A0A0G2HLU3_9SYNE|nr:MAG: hypothetical protein TE42_03210 [Candidatus Synechococcus spongiarum SP3]
MINRNPAVRLGLVVWLLGFWCAGCSGTPFGEQLTERLSEPDALEGETAAPNSAAVNVPTGEQLTEQPSESGDPVGEASPSNPTAAATAMDDIPVPDAAPAPPPNARQEASPPDPTTTQPSQLLNPTPYRLLLRLPAADPAAPAEAVTQALRAAGILFEVETVERLPNEANTAPPTPPKPSP